MRSMAIDDTFGPDESVGERRDETGRGVRLPDDTCDEMRVNLRASDSTDETPAPNDGERGLRVSRYDPAAARCGRWGDERWR